MLIIICRILYEQHFDEEHNDPYRQDFTALKKMSMRLIPSIKAFHYRYKNLHTKV